MVKYKAKWYDNKPWLSMMYLDKGYTISEIAAFAGVSTETVRKLLLKHDLKGIK